MVPCAAILQLTSKFCTSIKEKKVLPSKRQSNHLFETQSVTLLHVDTCRTNLMAYRDAVEMSSMYLVALCLLSMHLSPSSNCPYEITAGCNNNDNITKQLSMLSYVRNSHIRVVKNEKVRSFVVAVHS